MKTQPTHSFSPQTPLDKAYQKGQQYKMALLQDSLSQQETAKKLNIDLEKLEQMKEEHQLLAILSDDNNDYYPLCQFNEDKPLKGLKEVLFELKELDSFMQLMFLTTGDVRLEGKTPIECLKMGEIEQVILSARCYGHHSAA